MKRENKAIALSILGLFVLSIFAMSFASAALTDTLNNFFGSNSIFTAQADLISKFLLIVLVVLLVFSVLSFVPLFPAGKTWIQWVISIIVGLLSFFFVSADNIKYVLANYEALGVMLTTVIPLVIIIVFTLKFREGAANAGYAGIVNKILIIGYIAYVGIRWATLTWGRAFADWPELAWLYPITMIGLLIWLFIERRIALSLYKQELKGQMTERFKEDVAEATAELEEAQEKIKNLTGAPAKSMQQKIDRLQAYIDKFTFK